MAISPEQRLDNYRKQSRRKELTPRQRRRVEKKAARMTRRPG
jgi:hypothetical protein